MSPVAVTKMSPIGAASAMVITRKPFMTASRARVGCTSVTMTFAPKPCARIAMPLLHQPYPPTTKFLPAIRTDVALRMPSIVL